MQLDPMMIEAMKAQAIINIGTVGSVKRAFHTQKVLVTTNAILKCTFTWVFLFDFSRSQFHRAWQVDLGSCAQWCEHHSPQERAGSRHYDQARLCQCGALQV